MYNHFPYGDIVDAGPVEEEDVESSLIEATANLNDQGDRLAKFLPSCHRFLAQATLRDWGRGAGHTPVATGILAAPEP